MPLPFPPDAFSLPRRTAGLDPCIARGVHKVLSPVLGLGDALVEWVLVASLAISRFSWFSTPRASLLPQGWLPVRVIACDIGEHLWPERHHQHYMRPDTQ